MEEKLRGLSNWLVLSVESVYEHQKLIKLVVDRKLLRILSRIMGVQFCFSEFFGRGKTRSCVVSVESPTSMPPLLTGTRSFASPAVPVCCVYDCRVCSVKRCIRNRGLFVCDSIEHKIIGCNCFICYQISSTHLIACNAFRPSSMAEKFYHTPQKKASNNTMSTHSTHMFSGVRLIG